MPLVLLGSFLFWGAAMRLFLACLLPSIALLCWRRLFVLSRARTKTLLPLKLVAPSFREVTVVVAFHVLNLRSGSALHQLTDWF